MGHYGPAFHRTLRHYFVKRSPKAVAWKPDTKVLEMSNRLRGSITSTVLQTNCLLSYLLNNRRSPEQETVFKGLGRSPVHFLLENKMISLTCLLIVLLGTPDILPDEEMWLDDPNKLPTLFTEWRRERDEPYLTVLVENWLRTSRLRNYPKWINGRLYERWYAPHSWAGDLNHDGITNMQDFGIAAKYYVGEIHVLTRIERAAIWVNDL